MAGESAPGPRPRAVCHSTVRASSRKVERWLEEVEGELGTDERSQLRWLGAVGAVAYPQLESIQF